MGRAEQSSRAEQESDSPTEYWSLETEGKESEEDTGRRERKNLLIAAELSYLEWSKSARRDAALCEAMRCDAMLGEGRWTKDGWTDGGSRRGHVCMRCGEMG